MPTRRALIVAPLYDGKWLPPLPGIPNFIKAIVPLLRGRGRYDARVLSGVVTQPVFRQALGEFFDTDGELLFYYYGHGCLRPPGEGVFAASDAQERNEGVAMQEIGFWADRSNAREVIAILDCCHAGATVSVTIEALNREADQGFSNRPGRAILAACSANQRGWEAQDDAQQRLGAFSSHVIEGIEGAARLRRGMNVRASVLGAHVTDVFSSWQQSPVCKSCETGDRHCIIASGFNAEPALKIAKAKYIGVPFKPSATFVGRSAEIDFLRSMLLDGSKPIAVSATVEGLGGIGKTELVLQLLNDQGIASAFATIVWLDGAGPLLPQWEEVARKLELGIAKDSVTLLKEIVGELKDRGDALFVLDNASQWETIMGQIPDEFPLLVTTRTRDFGGPSFHHTELGVLTNDAAKEFFVKLIPGIATNATLPRLIEILEGHALAIELAGHYIRDFCSPEEYVSKLNSLQNGIPEDIVGKTQYKRTVDSCIQITWDSLKSDSARLLWRKAALFAPTSAHRDLLRVSFTCGVKNGGEAKYLVREILYEARYHHRERRPGRPQNWREFDETSLSIVGKAEEFDSAYSALRDCHILSRVEGFNGERWAMHRLVRDFARARLEKFEISIHAMSLADWLRDPSLPIEIETPHFVAAILDAARAGYELGGRRFEREIRGRGPITFQSEYMLRFIRDQLNDPKALTLILSGLSDINSDVRVASIELLENAGPIPEVFDGLANALEDPDPDVRNTAGETLAHHGGERTVSILSQALHGPNARTRITGVRALALMGEKGQDALGVALNNGDENVRIEAALSLCEQGRSEAADMVADMLGSRSSVSIRAIFALASIGDERAIGPLGDLLRDSNASARYEAVEHLKEMGSTAAVTTLISALDHVSGYLKKEIIDALVEIGSPAPISKFEHIAEVDKEIEIRKAAAAAVKKLRKE
jgi:HEAT repeat protein